MVVVRDRVVVGLLFLCCCSTARHDIFEFVGQVLCCCVVGRRVGVGRVEAVFSVCFITSIVCSLIGFSNHCFVIALHVDLSRRFCISAVSEHGSAQEYVVKLHALFG